jgi:hypothetical protein
MGLMFFDLRIPDETCHAQYVLGLGVLEKRELGVGEIKNNILNNTYYFF